MSLKHSLLVLLATSIFASVLSWTNEYNRKNHVKEHFRKVGKNAHNDNESKENGPNSVLSRRQVFGSTASSAAILTTWPSIANGESATEGMSRLDKLHFRERKSNKGTLIREDYWFMMGKTPPRKLDGPLITDDPEFNAFGSCETTQSNGGSNSCTYVSLKQRIPTYSKYGFSIALGAREYSMLGSSLRKGDWKGAVSYLMTEPQQPPPPSIDALLKMVLFASGMLTSPNYSGPSKRLLVARFYANEVGFAIEEIKEAVDERDQQRAIAAWEFGKDSWNSYYQIVNDSISVKVGDKFEPIS